MRFVVTGEWSRNTLLRLIVAMFLVFVLLFVVSSAMLFFTRMSLDPAKVVEYFLGEPHLEFGRPPRPYKALVETSHMHLFAMGMLVMVLTHLLLFVPIKPALKGWLVLVSFAAALLDELSNWLVRFASPAFAWLKIGSFVVMEVSLSLLVIVLAVYVARPGRNAYKDTQPKG
ncbi:MAG: hypothetical protein H6704_27615 [Myxococcales bacterium]|nr:hypothetical protein [Myxococcales bacterium]MCB9539999.1 hypothetical protein [Myxococcales bacterium]